MLVILGLVLGVGLTAAAPPVAVFAPWDGTWEGTFVGYDVAGKELYRLDVRQVYRTVDGETQTVEITDRGADGKVITGRGANTARRQADGSLVLECRVEKSNGDQVLHRGQVGTAPDGGAQIVWSSDTPGRVESFREAVRQVNGEWVYTIDGVGRYGDQLVVMAGRYRRR